MYRYLGRYSLDSACREQKQAKRRAKARQTHGKRYNPDGARLRNLYLGRVRDDGGPD